MADIKITDYTTGTTPLQHPSMYEATPATIQPDDSHIIDGQLKAGTFYPANDATVKGIIMQDYSVTDKPVNVALVYAGTINTAKLSEQPSDAAKTALPRITWFTK